jgi:hypothetical protein
MRSFPELEILKRSLTHRDYDVRFVQREDYSLLVLSREKNILDRTAFYEIEDCGFRFTEVRLDKDGHVKAMFHRDEEKGRFSDLA